MLTLICDDDPIYSRAIARILPGQKLVAPDLKTGLEMVESYRPNVVLLDMWMPDGWGMTAIPEIHLLSPTTKVIAMSNRARKADGLRAIGEFGAIAYLDKFDDRGAFREEVARGFRASLNATLRHRLPPRRHGEPVSDEISVLPRSRSRSTR